MTHLIKLHFISLKLSGAKTRANSTCKLITKSPYYAGCRPYSENQASIPTTTSNGAWISERPEADSSAHLCNSALTC